MCQCGEQVVVQLVFSEDIHTRLLDLYHKDYMALSIKLMILRALDSSLCCQQTVEHFLGNGTKTIKFKDSKNNFKNKDVLKDKFYKNHYRTLIRMLQGNQLARVKFAISCLLRKLHTYEVLERLYECVRQIVESGPNGVCVHLEDMSDDLIKMKEEQRISEVGSPPEAVGLEISEQEMDIIVSCLEEILKVYRDAPLAISQPKRFLPVCAQFEIATCPQDPYPALFAFFRCHHLLECCLLLLSCPATSGYSAITGPVQEILTALLDSQDGMQFLASNPETSTAILRVLLTQPPPVSPGPPEENMEEGSGSTAPMQQLGLFMAYRLQALQYVDALLEIVHSSNTQPDPDQNDVLENLHGLFSLALSPSGKQSVVHVLSRGNNITPLLQFLNIDDHFQNQQNYQINNNKLKTSPGKCYAADLVVMTVRYSDYVPFLQKFGKEILEIAQKEEQSPSCRLFEVIPWLKPVGIPRVFLYDNITQLSEIVTKNVDNATLLPGELITALRILKFLGIPPREKYLNCNIELFESEEYMELKYKYVILQLFSLEGVSNILAVLQKLCEFYEQPMLHATNFIGHQGATLVSLILPAVQLLRRMLTYVINCRNTEFKDLTAVSTLLQTYSLMHAFPSSSLAFIDSQCVCREIIETLLAYSQPISTDLSSEAEALNKSLWTLMMAEVVKYVTIGPHTFVPGLLILSELLPLPLPVQTRTPLSDEEVSIISIILN